MKRTLAIALVALVACFTPVRQEARGPLVCEWEGERVLVADLQIEGEGVLSVSDLSGGWALCASNRPLKCWISFGADAGVNDGGQP